MKVQIHKILLCLLVLFCFQAFAFAQEKTEKERFDASYDEETDKTTVLLNLMELPGNKESFKIGALFEFNGKVLEKEPCCAVIVMTSVGKKKFRFEDNHAVTILADKKKFIYEDALWREAGWATAFVIAQIAYPEEILVGMKTAEFQKIAKAKKVKVEVGDFKFEMTSAQIKGFQELAEKMKPNLNK